jgi:DNA primase
VIGAARGLADVIWSREIEGGSYATPERRAALEARIKELTNGIRDEVVRRYYRQDLAQRLQRTFAPEDGRGGYGRGNYPRAGSESGRRFAPRGSFTPGVAGRFEPRGPRSQAPAGSQTINRQPYQVASPQLALSPIMRGQRSAMSRREALILQSLINHPWLLHDHLEEVAALELAHPEAHRLRAGIIAAFANDHHHGAAPDEQGEKMRADLAGSGLSQVLQRVERAITTSAVWGTQAGAAPEDVLSTWRQLVSLHRQWHSLLRELKDAEAALGVASRCQGPVGVPGRHRGPDRGFWRILGPVPTERLTEKCCGWRSPEPRNDSPNPWFGCKNRVNRSLGARGLSACDRLKQFEGGDRSAPPFARHT